MARFGWGRNNQMVEFLGTVLVSVLASGGVAWALIQYFGDKIVAHRLTKDIERYKTELSSKTEVLKTQLSIFAHEQNIQLARVDTQRAKAIHEVYACICEVIESMANLEAGSPIVGGSDTVNVDFYVSNAESAHKRCGKLTDVLSKNAIYFENETYAEIVGFTSAAMNASAMYLQGIRREIATGANASRVLAIAESGRPEIKKAMAEKIKPRVGDLVSRFRKQLGIEPSGSAKTSAV